MAAAAGALACALAAALTGALSALPFAILHITAKRLRNGALIRRGAPPYKDVIFAPGPFALLFALVGALAGALTGALGAAWWPSGALAGLAVPALLTAVVLVATALQARAPAEPAELEPPAPPEPSASERR